MALKSRLTQEFRSRGLLVAAPTNCQPVQITLQTRKTVKAVGALAAATDDEDRILSDTSGATLAGLIVRRPAHEANRYLLLAPADLPHYAPPLAAAGFASKVRLPWWGTWAGAQAVVAGVFELDVALDEDAAAAALAAAQTNTSAGDAQQQQLLPPQPLRARRVTLLGGAVALCQHPLPLAAQTEYTAWFALPAADRARAPAPATLFEPQLVVSWTASPIADMAADTLVALFMSLEANPGAVRMLSKGATGCCAAESSPAVTVGNFADSAPASASGSASAYVGGGDAESVAKEERELEAQTAMRPYLAPDDEDVALANSANARADADATANTDHGGGVTGVKSEPGAARSATGRGPQVKTEPGAAPPKPTASAAPTAAAAAEPVPVEPVALIDDFAALSAHRASTKATAEAFTLALRAELASIETVDASADAPAESTASVTVGDGLRPQDMWDPRWSAAALAELEEMLANTFGANAFALDAASRALFAARCGVDAVAAAAEAGALLAGTPEAAAEAGAVFADAITDAATEAAAFAPPAVVSPAAAAASAAGAAMSDDATNVATAAAAAAAAAAESAPITLSDSDSLALAVSPAAGSALASALAAALAPAPASAAAVLPGAPAALRRLLTVAGRRGARIAPSGFVAPLLVFVVDGVPGLLRLADMSAASLGYNEYAALFRIVSTANATSSTGTRAKCSPLPREVYDKARDAIAHHVERQAAKACGALFPLRLSDIVLATDADADATGEARGSLAGDEDDDGAAAGAAAAAAAEDGAGRMALLDEDGEALPDTEGAGGSGDKDGLDVAALMGGEYDGDDSGAATAAAPEQHEQQQRAMRDEYNEEEN